MCKFLLLYLSLNIPFDPLLVLVTNIYTAQEQLMCLRISASPLNLVKRLEFVAERAGEEKNKHVTFSKSEIFLHILSQWQELSTLRTQ
jgi:hypothetical protein